jgi:uncharacterized protein
MNKSVSLIKKIRIEPQSGTAFNVTKGQVIRIIDVEGQQVADLFCFASHDLNERLSSGHTVDYTEKLFLTTGDVLYSSASNPMLTITADQVGSHFMLFAPCSQKMYEKSYGVTEAHPNCLDNLANNLKQYGLTADQITVPLNIFMHIEISAEGDISIQPPRSQAGDFIELHAEMDLIVGISACSAGICNNYTWSLIEVEIYSGEHLISN